MRTITAEAKDTAAQVASDVNETADDEAVEIPTTSQQKTTGKQTVGDSPSSQPRSSHVLEDAEAVINGMLVTIEGDKAAATPNQVSVAHGKTGSSKRKRRSHMKGTVSVAVAFCMKMRLKVRLCHRHSTGQQQKRKQNLPRPPIVLSTEIQI
ncbi:hypothetical protein PF008_g24540 [Phytophthora fragariae]|uniref:Uncharacterized protein n=1 Tax=Phytophthora fragariae TaxID=53985 RepID=A0A6G0QNJ5_9STRA|nr:hypothetical protein PF008_g24540 [Phytophthora fragariae]